MLAYPSLSGGLGKIRDEPVAAWSELLTAVEVQETD